MPMLPARHYESEHTRFMRELMERRRDLPDQQREARAIWWDKDPLELAADSERREVAGADEALRLPARVETLSAHDARCFVAFPAGADGPPRGARLIQPR